MSQGRFTSILAATGALAGAFALASSPTPSSSTAGEARRVAVASVELGRLERMVGFPGSTRAADRAELAFLVGGRVAERSVEVGDRVRAGQVIARLDTREVNNGVSVARAELARSEAARGQLQRDVERSEALLAARAATREEVERTQAGLDSALAVEGAARAALAEAERRLGEAVLRAPYAGVVVATHAEVGENVTSGRRIISLAGSSALEVEIEVPENVIAGLELDEVVRVSFPTSARDPLEARVSRLARDSFGAGALFPVVVALPPRPDLVAGLTTRVELDLGLEQSLLVPIAAVVDPGGRRPTLYRIVDGRAERVEIEVLGFEGDRVAVSGSLAAGDVVVVGGQRGLLDGEVVELVR